MIVYRIAKKKRINDLSGIGAKLSGGRWNPKGIPVLYYASTSSLAILETLVNVDFDLLPHALYIAEFEIPDSDIQKITISDLPKNWNQHPSPDTLKLVGQKWINQNKSLTLEVPSAVNPHEVNLLLNVNHPHFHRVKLTKTYSVILDNRLTNK